MAMARLIRHCQSVGQMFVINARDPGNGDLSYAREHRVAYRTVAMHERCGERPVLRPRYVASPPRIA